MSIIYCIDNDIIRDWWFVYFSYNIMFKFVSLNCGYFGCFECLKEFIKKVMVFKCLMC